MGGLALHVLQDVQHQLPAQLEAVPKGVGLGAVELHPQSLVQFLGEVLAHLPAHPLQVAGQGRVLAVQRAGGGRMDGAAVIDGVDVVEHGKHPFSSRYKEQYIKI